MEDDLNILANGRHLNVLGGKCKTTSTLWKMEDNLNLKAKKKTTSILRKQEDDLSFKINER
jgi:hypothetical protein